MQPIFRVFFLIFECVLIVRRASERPCRFLFILTFNSLCESNSIAFCCFCSNRIESYYELIKRAQSTTIHTLCPHTDSPIFTNHTQQSLSHKHTTLYGNIRGRSITRRSGNHKKISTQWSSSIFRNLASLAC